MRPSVGSASSWILNPLIVLLCSKVSDRDHRGLTARDSKPSESGALAHRASAKIGGDLQGEPIFRLPGPASALTCPSNKARVLSDRIRPNRGKQMSNRLI